MSVQARLPESERLRLLGIMGVDVYVPRATPLARAVDAAPVHEPATRRAPTAPSLVAARVLIRGVGADEHSPLLAAVMRGARLRRQDWALANESTGTLPEWQFGKPAIREAKTPIMALPSLAELRDSVSMRRDTWHLLRTWLRRA